MAKPNAATLRANSEAAAEHPPADGSAVDGAGPATAADVPAAGPTATAIVPADGAGVDEHLHADVRHPALLPAGRDAPGPRGCPWTPKVRSTGQIRKTSIGEAQENLRSSTQWRMTG